MCHALCHAGLGLTWVFLMLRVGGWEGASRRVAIEHVNLTHPHTHTHTHTHPHTHTHTHAHAHAHTHTHTHTHPGYLCHP